MGTVQASYPIYGAPPPPVDRNAMWQQVNETLGATFDATFVPASEYLAKFQVMTTGNDLPDLVSLAASQQVPRLSELLEARFADLSEHLSGDAILDYPNLAALPTDAWKTVIHNGKIFGIPLAAEPMTSILFARGDLLDDLDMPTELANFDELTQVWRDVTDPRENRWAIGTLTGAIEHVMSMLGRPYQWQEIDGTVTHRIETEECRQCLSSLAQLWQDGVFHPDALAASGADSKQFLVSGSVVFHWDNIIAWTEDVFKQARISSRLAGVVPQGFSGGPGVSALNAPSVRATLIAKNEPNRVKELLRIMDWLSAPFGTQEYLLKTFGVPEVDHTLEGSDPVLTNTGIAETGMTLRLLGNPSIVTYAPGEPDVVKAIHGYGTAVQDIQVENPILTLRSETNQEVAAVLNPMIGDVTMEVITGKADVSALDEVMAEWRSQGGDDIRADYEEGLAQQES